ncbi:MAG: hypothetical protein CSB28_01530 [Desulfobacterales bacterium]|nr:MAG: hypothetical protein CSB28_01530 [Desulfobacterales bacterium]
MAVIYSNKKETAVDLRQGKTRILWKSLLPKLDNESWQRKNILYIYTNMISEFNKKFFLAMGQICRNRFHRVSCFFITIRCPISFF